MKSSAHIPASLIISVVLSGILHAAAFSVTTGAYSLDIPAIAAGKVLFASLVERTPSKPPVKILVKKSGEGRPASVSSFSGVAAQPAASGEGAVEREAVLPALNKTAVENPAADSKVGAENTASDTGKEKASEVALNKPEGPAVKPARPDDGRKILNFTREKFSYEIYWLGIYVGKAVLEAVRENGVVRITSQVHSAPFISTFYKVEDYAESRLKGGVPFNFRIRQQEGKYRSDKETLFDPGARKITYFDYLKGTKDEHSTAESVFWDVISGFYHLRTRQIEPDKTVFVDIFDSNKFLNAEVSVLGMEKVRFAGGKEVDAIVVKPVLKSDGLFQNKGDIRIWLSNDENRTPLRVETSVSIGNVVAELKQIETEK